MDLALFDFDGTITDREMFAAYLRHAVPRPRRLAFSCLLLPWVAGYRAGWVSPCRMRAVAVRTALAGLPVGLLQAAAADYARTSLPRVLHPRAMERIAWHQACGDEVVVVTGALELALAPWCAEQDLALLGSRLEVRRGRLTGRYLGAQCVGEEKARRVRSQCNLAAYDTIHAYGDTPEDHALLALAHQRTYRWQPEGACG